MKKKAIIIGGVVVAILAIVLIVLLSSPRYTIKVSIVDDQSPDRILTVYNSKNEKIEVRKIEYLDGTLLCNGYNTTVHYGDIEHEKVLKVILKDNSVGKARVIIEEVK